MRDKQVQKSPSFWRNVIALLSVTVGVGASFAQTADITIPIVIKSQNYFSVDLRIFLDDLAVKGLDDFDVGAIVPPTVFPDEARVSFVDGARLLLDEALPKPSGSSTSQFLVRANPGTPFYQVATLGLAYNDINGNDACDTGDDVWVDRNKNGRYDDTETRLTNATSWNTDPGTVGEISGLYFTDANGNGEYDDDEDVWSDQTFGAGAVMFDSVNSTEIFAGSDGVFDTDNDTPGASVHTIVLAWDPAALPAEFDAQIRKANGEVLVSDMKAGGDSTLVLTSPQDVLIVFGTGNSAPIAGDFELRTVEDIALTGDEGLNLLGSTDVVFDIDDGDTLNLVGVGAVSTDTPANSITTAEGGTATIVGGVIEYTPLVGFSSDPFDSDTFDSFTYTVSDGVLQSVGTIHVVVFPGAVVANRTHASRAKTGDVDADAGLLVTVTVGFASAAGRQALTHLRLEEFFPLGDNPGEEWTLKVVDAGAAEDTLPRYDIDVTAPAPNHPPTTVVNGENRNVTFEWDTASLPDADSFTFTYRIVGPLADRAVKTMDGDLFFSTEIGDAGDVAANAVPSSIRGNDTFLATDRLGDLNIDENQVYDVDDLILVFNKWTIYDILDGQGQTALGLQILGGNDAVEGQRIVDKVELIEGRMDVNGDGSEDVDDLILIFNKLTIYDVLAGQGQEALGLQILGGNDSVEGQRIVDFVEELTPAID